MSPLSTMSPRTARPLVLSLAGLGLVGALAGCAAPAGTGTDGGAGSGSTDGGGTTTNGDYTDGTYTAEGSYQAPSGTESVTVELTLADNIVTELTVTGDATGGTQKSYQDKFVSGINAEVVGKDIDEVNVSRVAGSSLTSGGFNAAIATIKADAAA